MVPSLVPFDFIFFSLSLSVWRLMGRRLPGCDDFLMRCDEKREPLRMESRAAQCCVGAPLSLSWRAADTETKQTPSRRAPSQTDGRRVSANARACSPSPSAHTLRQCIGLQCAVCSAVQFAAHSVQCRAAQEEHLWGICMQFVALSRAGPATVCAQAAQHSLCRVRAAPKPQRVRAGRHIWAWASLPAWPYKAEAAWPTSAAAQQASRPSGSRNTGSRPGLFQLAGPPLCLLPASPSNLGCSFGWLESVLEFRLCCRGQGEAEGGKGGGGEIDRRGLGGAD